VGDCLRCGCCFCRQPPPPSSGPRLFLAPGCMGDVLQERRVRRSQRHGLLAGGDATPGRQHLQHWGALQFSPFPRRFRRLTLRISFDGTYITSGLSRLRRKCADQAVVIGGPNRAAATGRAGRRNAGGRHPFASRWVWAAAPSGKGERKAARGPRRFGVRSPNGDGSERLVSLWDVTGHGDVTDRAEEDVERRRREWFVGEGARAAAGVPCL
jgi:hypothetical protein